jgi:hypothetical protein
VFDGGLVSLQLAPLPNAADQDRDWSAPGLDDGPFQVALAKTWDRSPIDFGMGCAFLFHK